MAKTLLVLALFLGLILLTAWQFLMLVDARGVRDFQSAYISFFNEAATQSCITKDAILKAAQAREWQVQDPSPWTIADGKTAIQVHVDPPLPFAKQPGVRFTFDAKGCLIK